MMSSATSIDDAAAARTDVGKETEATSTFSAWHFFVLISLIAASAAVVLAQQNSPENLLLISLTIGAAGAAGFALYRVLVPLTAPEIEPLAQPLSERLRADLEREKMLALRAIKELEFDRAMGKIAEGDFMMLRDRLRARALRLIAQLDGAAAYRDMIERDLAARLPVESRHTESAPGPIARPACAACGALNETDARFCKMCGHAIEVTASSVR